MTTEQILLKKVEELKEMLRVAMIIQSNETADDYVAFIITRGGVGDQDDAYEFIKQHDRFIGETNDNQIKRI